MIESFFNYFGWLVSLLLGAYIFKVKSEYTRESAENLLNKNNSDKYLIDIADLKKKIEIQNSQLIDLKEKNTALEITTDIVNKTKIELVETHKLKMQELEGKLESIRREKDLLSKKVAQFEQSEQQRAEKHAEHINRLDVVFRQREEERQREILAKEQAELARLQNLKETWSRHEARIEEKIRAICNRQEIEYIDKENFPHKGKPDNCIKICNEFIVLDSKSPQGDDLSNFPSYIKREAEAAKKYTKNDDVRKDVFLVVPTNAIHLIEETYKVYGDYRVYVITEDSLEPVMMSLKKIEDYEFADKLSPEGRETIVSVLGKMAHGMKRRIQVDHFFANEFISVLTDAENLPSDILAEAQDVERTSKMNPPLERRAKMIDSQALIKKANKLAGKAKGQEIDMDANLSSIDAIPLYVDAKKEEVKE